MYNILKQQNYLTLPRGIQLGIAPRRSQAQRKEEGRSDGCQYFAYKEKTEI